MTDKIRLALEALEAMQFDDQERKLLTAELLNKIPQDARFGQELTYAIRRLTYSVSFEAVILRNIRQVDQEVYLHQRGEGESYPGEWYCMGTTFNVGESVLGVVGRLGRRLGSPIGQFADVGRYWSVKEPSSIGGSYLALVHLVQVLDNVLLQGGRWFRTSDLPEKMVITHRDHIIPMALKALKIPQPE
jgi:hypothetical protein